MGIYFYFLRALNESDNKNLRQAFIDEKVNMEKLVLEVVKENTEAQTENFEKESQNLIKSINQELNVNTAILADLQGPKIRIGKLEKNINLKNPELEINIEELNLSLIHI